MIDIVVMTCERLALLKETLRYIWERTTTSYQLHVIDDASTGGNAEYLSALEAEGRVASVHLHKQRVGIAAHLRAIEKITASDPVVFTDDDILCPRLEPDWLARGLSAMERLPKVGLLALNNPQCNIAHSRGDVVPGYPVTLCRNVPGSFVFVRRAVLARCRPDDDSPAPVKMLCRLVMAAGWLIGYLTDVYCQHIGAVSVRNNRDLGPQLEMVLPVNGDTLVPPAEYRW